MNRSHPAYPLYVLLFVGLFSSTNPTASAGEKPTPPTRMARAAVPIAPRNSTQPPATEPQATDDRSEEKPQASATPDPAATSTPGMPSTDSLMRSVGSFALFSLLSLLPAAVLTPSYELAWCSCWFARRSGACKCQAPKHYPHWHCC